MSQAKILSPIILRIGISLVFLWFGTSQLLQPDNWISWLPDYASTFPFSPRTLIYLNGGFEVLFGLLLILGFYTRFAALLLALHAVNLLTVVGYNAIGVRDFGILVGTIAIFLNGSDTFSLDHLFTKKNNPSFAPY